MRALYTIVSLNHQIFPNFFIGKQQQSKHKYGDFH